MALATAVTAPGQVLLTLGGEATFIEPGACGRLSTSAWLRVIGAELGLFSTMVRRDVPFAGITAGANCLPTLGGVLMITSALVGSSLVTPSLVLTAPVGMVLTLLPGVLLSTSTVTVQLAPAASVAPVRRTEVADAAAMTTPPGQVVLAFGACATTRPLGRLSCTRISLRALLALTLLRNRVRVFASPARATAVPLAKPAVLLLSSVRLSMALCSTNALVTRWVSSTGG